MTDQPERLYLSSIIAYAHETEALANDLALRSFKPLDPTSFNVRLQVFVGGTEGGPVDSFDLDVCTPKWLAENFNRVWQQHRLPGGRAASGAGVWLVESWDPDGIESTIRQLVASATGSDWKDLANWLGRYIPWEFDYKYDREKGVQIDLDTLYPSAERQPTDS
jgi:hypothetical protein